MITTGLIKKIGKRGIGKIAVLLLVTTIVLASLFCVTALESKSAVSPCGAESHESLWWCEADMLNHKTIISSALLFGLSILILHLLLFGFYITIGDNKERPANNLVSPIFSKPKLSLLNIILLFSRGLIHPQIYG